MQLSQCPWFCTACTKLWARVVECLFPLARPVARTIAISASRNQQKKKPEPVTGPPVVTRTITRGLARVDAGLDDCLTMGNLDSLRDWGHARDTRLVVGPNRISDLLLSLYRTREEAVQGLDRPLPQGVPAGTMHWAFNGLRKPAPRALSRLADQSGFVLLLNRVRLQVAAKGQSNPLLGCDQIQRSVPLAQHGKPSRHR